VDSWLLAKRKTINPQTKLICIGFKYILRKMDYKTPVYRLRIA
jgi:hypothetical protein